MFFRIKRISGKEYAYIVKNRWTDNGPRQKVVGYAGKIIKPEKKNPIAFEQFVSVVLGKESSSYMDNMEFDQTITDLIMWELYKHGGEMKQDGKLILNGMEIRLEDGMLNAGKRKIVVRLNEGYLCNNTLKQVFDAGIGDESDVEAGFDFAHALINAGLDVPKEIFVKLYEKLS